LKPAKERVISLHFADSDLNDATGKAWTELNAYSPEQLASIGDYYSGPQNPDSHLRWCLP
jgi:hypothetical protein